jgi:hypothetical protein
VSLAQGTDAEVEECALAVFVHHYCLIPKCRSIAGLQIMLSHTGPSSTLAQAAKIVALANIGTRLGRSSLVQKARILYSDMLRSFRMMIANATISSAELLMTVVLLGLYEVRIKFMSTWMSDFD